MPGLQTLAEQVTFPSGTIDRTVFGPYQQDRYLLRAAAGYSSSTNAVGSLLVMLFATGQSFANTNGINDACCIVGAAQAQVNITNLLYALWEAQEVVAVPRGYSIGVRLALIAPAVADQASVRVETILA